MSSCDQNKRRGRPKKNVERLSDGEEGNTNPPSDNKKSSDKQPHQLKFWSFTWNNFEESKIETLVLYFKEHCVWYVFQHEIGGNSETNHLQGTIFLKNKARWTEFGLPKQIHWEKTEEINDAIKYCMKLDDIGGRVADDRIWHSPNFHPPMTEKIMWNGWNQYLVDQIRYDSNRRKIFWFWSKCGKMGKTSFVRYCYDKFGAQFATGGKYTDIMNLVYHTDMENTKVIFFTLPREHKAHISYSALESIKDGLVSNMKSFKNGSKKFNNIPHVMVFGNYPPDLSKCSADRWIVHQIDWMKDAVEEAKEYKY